MIRIGVVGFGATGLSFLAQFLKIYAKFGLSKKVSISIFEASSTNLSVGNAYRDVSNSFLLNSPADFFSIYPDDPSHFYRWVVQNFEKHKNKYPYISSISSIKKTTFLPRSLAGFYLHDNFEEIVYLAKKNNYIDINTMAEEIIDINYKTDSLVLIDQKYIQYEVDFVVLCTGTHYCRKYPTFYNCPQFIQNPFLGNITDKFNPLENDNTLILGTRLSAIDMAVFFYDNKFQGQIVMASPSGSIPSVRSHLKSYKLPYFNRENAQKLAKQKKLTPDDFFDLVHQEISRLYKTKIPKYLIKLLPINAQKTLIKDLKSIKQNSALWQQLLLNFVDIIEIFWRSFSLKDKKNFIHNYNAIIQRYTSSFPAINAEKLIKMINRGQLLTAKGPKNLCYDFSKNIFSADLKINGKELTMEFKYILNATGNEKNLLKTNSTFYLNLEKKNIVIFNSFGGLQVYTSSFKVKTKRGLKLNIYAAGAPTFGSFFFVDTLYTASLHAKCIAIDIAKQIKRDVIYQ